MSFYPFGLQLCDGTTDSNVQSHRYNDKELNRLNRLLWYDQSARQYNPILGRFMAMDPLCEKYYSISPYAFCANNPVRYVDLDGRQLGDFIDKNGNVIGSDGKNDGKLYVINTKENNFHENREIGDGVKGANNTKYKQVVDFVKANSTPSAYDADKTAWAAFVQHPSQTDIDNSGDKINYVFGMRDNKTYIYNNKGILDVLPTKKFVSPTPIKK